MREIRENLATDMNVGLPQGRIQSMMAMIDEVGCVAEGLLDMAKSTQAKLNLDVMWRADGDQPTTGTGEAQRNSEEPSKLNSLVEKLGDCAINGVIELKQLAKPIATSVVEAGLGMAKTIKEIPEKIVDSIEKATSETDEENKNAA